MSKRSPLLVTTLLASALNLGAPGSHASDELDPALEPLRTFLGQWEVTTQWFDGGLLWAQMTNTIEAGGREIHSRVLAAEGGKEPYERYRIRYFADETGTVQEHLSSYKGVVVQQPLSTQISSAGSVLKVTYPPGTLAATGIRKELSPGSLTMLWNDYFQDEKSGEWERVIDADWVRTAPVEAARPTMPIDDSLFVASGSDLRTFTVERLMEAPQEEVWNAWTNEDDWKNAYGPDRPELRPNIELAIGGKYEWLFNGEIGSNGCQVLSYLPPRMLSFSWNAPVAQAHSREKRTWLVVEIEPAENGRTLVRATQLGFGQASHWDETMAYFGQGWTHVLDRMAASFADRTE